MISLRLFENSLKCVIFRFQKACEATGTCAIAIIPYLLDKTFLVHLPDKKFLVTNPDGEG